LATGKATCVSYPANLRDTLKGYTLQYVQKQKKTRRILHRNLYDLPKDKRAVVQIEIGSQTSFWYLASSPSPTHFFRTFKTSFLNTVIYVPIGKYYTVDALV
jgi:hypothetical protein